MTVMNRREFQLSGAALVALLLSDADARAAALSQLEDVRFGAMNGKLARPKGTAKGGMLLIHEWWGLNEQMQFVAAAMAEEGYLTLAVDMFGNVATTVEDARANTQSVDPVAGTAGLVAGIEMLRSEGVKNVATMGFCFGGGWSLNASLASPVEATIIYYGRVNKSAEELAPLKGPVLGHFGTKDKFINPDMVAGFEQALSEAGKTFDIYSYDADHAFANPTSTRYDELAAVTAYERTLAFLKAHIDS